MTSVRSFVATRPLVHSTPENGISISNGAIGFAIPHVTGGWSTSYTAALSSWRKTAGGGAVPGMRIEQAVRKIKNWPS